MIPRAVFLSLLAAVSLAGNAFAQHSIDFDATREELRQKLDSLQVHLDGNARRASSKERGSAWREARRIQSRLEHGDFRPGDAIQLTVPGESSLTGTYQVNAARALDLPAAGTVDVGGLLYSEAEQRIRNAVESVIRAPRIEVQPLIRLAVLGQVSDPGYYDLDPSATVSDALMAAGGPTQGAAVQNTMLRKPESAGRDDEGRRIESLTGRSLTELGIARGDEVFVPGSGGGLSLRTVATVLGIVSSVTFAITRF